MWSAALAGQGLAVETRYDWRALAGKGLRRDLVDAYSRTRVNIIKIRCLLRASIFVSTFYVARGQKIRALTFLRGVSRRLVLNFSLSRFVHVLAFSHSRILVFFMFPLCIIVFCVSSPSRKLASSSSLCSRDLFSQTRVLVFSHPRIFHVLADYFRKLAFSPRTREYEGTRIRGETNQPP